jgi:transposase
MIEARKDVLVERDLPDPEVTPKAKRRIFKAAYKKRILAEIEAAAGSGNIGEILRREGIYSSTLTGGARNARPSWMPHFLRSAGRSQNTIH